MKFPESTSGGITIQAVILAAGKGIRLRPITQQIPKALLPLGGKTLLQRLLETFEESGIARVAIGIGWTGDQIRSLVDSLDLSLEIHIVEVPDYEVGPLQTLVTTGMALPPEPTLLCPVDYVVPPNVLDLVLAGWSEAQSACILQLAVYKGDHGAVVHGTADGSLTGVGHPVSDGPIVGRSAMALILTSRFLEMCQRSLTAGQTSVWKVINKAVETRECTRYIQVPPTWVDIDQHSDLLRAAESLVTHMPGSIDGLVVPADDTYEIGTTLEIGPRTVFEQGVQIVGPAYVGSASTIGRNCVIGPNAFLESRVTLGADVTVSNTYLYQGTTIASNRKVQHSIVIGRDVIHVGD
ncbi:MAG: NDP-sugar synthase [Candidatus Thorarchaeota archaeon]|nr:NDP-sugar synthase [Candidatus Thorarchaeota archaeon]